ncbi:venom allergen 5-like [Harmonia axyridis]|uniref:venom allergen 5-like n=1 Tax=Harmonia axyridis TaxID=115357 RepID=UPI001E276457|nr:venom allergen 5-like [Harmonia axyridis]
MKLLPFLGILSSANFIHPNEYCHICKMHTMCKYKENTIPENCTDYRKIELTSENKTDIVEIHNNLRNFVASGGYVNETDIHFPEAAAMIYLKWSDELADIAQRWADQCRVDENQDECRDTEEFSIGQNVVIMEYPSNSSLPSLPDIFMTKWGNSFRYFSSKDILEFKSNNADKIGQYSQLIWDTTEYIGCGLITFKNHYVEEKGKVHTVRMVCNYGPAGNIDNTPIYKIGQPCSLCSSKKCHKKYRALCISDWKSRLSLEKSRLNEDIKQIMMEKYNIFRNGDDCFCETRYETDRGSPDVSFFRTSLVYVTTIWLVLFR